MIFKVEEYDLLRKTIAKINMCDRILSSNDKLLIKDLDYLLIKLAFFKPINGRYLDLLYIQIKKYFYIEGLDDPNKNNVLNILQSYQLKR